MLNQLTISDVNASCSCLLVRNTLLAPPSCFLNLHWSLIFNQLSIMYSYGQVIISILCEFSLYKLMENTRVDSPKIDTRATLKAYRMLGLLRDRKCNDWQLNLENEGPVCNLWTIQGWKVYLSFAKKKKLACEVHQELSPQKLTDPTIFLARLDQAH